MISGALNCVIYKTYCLFGVGHVFFIQWYIFIGIWVKPEYRSVIIIWYWTRYPLKPQNEYAIIIWFAFVIYWSQIWALHLTSEDHKYHKTIKLSGQHT